MLIDFFFALRTGEVPVTIRELLDLLGLLIYEELGPRSVDTFYQLARTTLVKDVRYYDRFDRVFGAFFRGIEFLPVPLPNGEIPAEWLRMQMERLFNADELARMEMLSMDELLRRLEQRLREQHERHQGGDTWIATGGTSPFGAFGMNPMGIRIGGPPRTGHAVRSWEQREFADLDMDAALGGRGWRTALRRLREFAHQGAEDVLNVPDTIRKTCQNAGRPEFVFERERAPKESVLLLSDRGGTMEPYVDACRNLFDAAAAEFKRLGIYYFHNCIYGSVRPQGADRNAPDVAISELQRHWKPNTMVILLGDAYMARDELQSRGWSDDHRTGADWLAEVYRTWRRSVWINPMQPEEWGGTVQTIRRIFEGRMYPLTLDGIDKAVKALK